MKQPFKFRGADLSASTRTDWLRVSPQMKKAAIAIGWTATDTPIGTLSIEVTDNPNNASGAPFPVSFGTNPAGTSDYCLLDNLSTGAEYIALVYTRTSGGTGAVFTDSTKAAGTFPCLLTKE